MVGVQRNKKESGLLSRYLSPKEFDELRQASRNPFYFSQFVKIVHPLRGKVPFNLYEYQRSVLYQFLQNRFNIILKFRQAGLTELIAMFCLWFAMYHPHKNIQIISIKDHVAKRVLKRIKSMYNALPDHLKQPVVNGRGEDIGTSQELEFANGSIIFSVPTTEEAGRSEAVSLLVIDEAAIVRWMGTIWASAFPTLSTGGRAIINSTPYGVGNWYHKQWVLACSGDSLFKPIRLRWQMHPERDQAWYEGMKIELGPRRTAQEVDGDFLASGLSVFDLKDIKAIEDSLVDYPPLDKIHLGGEYYSYIYSQPEKNGLYTLGLDVSSGRAHDYSAGGVMSQDGEEMASLYAKIPTRKLAPAVGDLGKKYNWALIAPESNDIGEAVTNWLQDNGYPKLYYTKATLRKKGEKRKEETKEIPGWYTTSKNRPIIIDELSEDIRQDNIIIKDPAFVREAYTFIYDNANRPVAMGKSSRSNVSEGGDLDEQVYTDDSILGKSITNYVRKGHTKKFITLPR